MQVFQSYKLLGSLTRNIVEIFFHSTISGKIELISAGYISEMEFLEVVTWLEMNQTVKKFTLHGKHN